VSRNNRLPMSKKMRTALAAASSFTRSIQTYLLAENAFWPHTREKQKSPDHRIEATGTDPSVVQS
jgi:hypothetical protein